MYTELFWHPYNFEMIRIAVNRLFQGLRTESFGSEGSLLESGDGSLKRKSSRGAAADPSSSRQRHPSLTLDDVTEENYRLRQHLAELKREIEEKDHTIHLLQQQMVG